MSADNGIYILVTLCTGKGTEYRVRELQAVDNVYWDGISGRETDEPKVMIKNAREMWKGCKVYYDREEALKEADRLYQKVMNSNFPVLEYGISFIKINRRF